MTQGVSIVMTPYNRTSLVRNTFESILRQNHSDLEVIVVEDRPTEASLEVECHRAGKNFRYFARRSRQEGWMNPAVLLNFGIKQATKEILIIQNGEVKYETMNGIEELVRPIETNAYLSTVPLVQALDKDGNFYDWYQHPTDQKRQGWISCFCQAVRRDRVMEIQGFDEVFNGYGCDDDIFEWRLRKSGVIFEYAKQVLVSHQWHQPYHYTGIEQENENILNELIRKTVSSEKPNVANFEKNWGVL